MAYVLPPDKHDEIILAAYVKRGFNLEEATAATRTGRLASWHGIKTHNALKALHLDDHFGSGNQENPGCTPGATIVKKPTRFEAALRWNANRKIGQAVATEAMEAAMARQDTTAAVLNAALWTGPLALALREAGRGEIPRFARCTSGEIT